MVDCEGYFTGAGMAELLRGEGHEVALVTPFEQAVHVCDQTLEGRGCAATCTSWASTLHRSVTVTAVTAAGLDGAASSTQPWQLEADAVVLVTQRVSDDALWRALAADPEALGARGSRASTGSATASRPA